jgi:LuxR family maltose regulon positive regulatory protein
MDTILSTKLHIPAAHPGCILRPRVIQKLNQDLWQVQQQDFLRRLTLIAAPAGYGKSTLLHEWIQHLDLPVAWITFDDSDNNLGRFLRYVMASLQTIHPELGHLDLGGLQNPESSASPELISNLIISLVNELTEIQRPFLFVFDDYHTLQAREIHQATALLLERLPQNLSLVIATRADPPLPLSRLRASRQMTEIRATDLQFSNEDACIFFQKVMNLDLKDHQVLALTEITEGWIAGLQMAALALQGRNDSDSFIRAFSGRERFIIDYLFEEVLSRQSETIQNFLLQTSILDQLSGPLCDAVCVTLDETNPAPVMKAGLPSITSQAMLEFLESANLFLIPLDNERQYYRYHHLFSDLLRHRLNRNFPALGPLLHARAAAWFEEQGNDIKAFDHWIAAGNQGKAARVVEKFGYQRFEQANFHQLSNWLQQIPRELILSLPWLCIFHSWGLIFTGQYGEVDLYLTSAERILGAITDTSPPDQRDLYGHVAVTRAFLATRSQDAEGIIHNVDVASKYVSSDKRAIRSYLAFFMGTGRYKKDQYSLAQESWREAARLGQEAGNVMIAVNSLVTLAELNRIQGKLHESANVFQEAARLALDERGKPLPVFAEVLVSRARLHYEWGDFASAEADLAAAANLMKLYTSFDLLVEYHTALAGLRLAQGETTLAADLIHPIEVSDRQPFYKAAAAFLACRINYYLTVGDLAKVEHILNQQDWSLEEKNIFSWAEAFIAYARVLAFKKEFQRANELLDTCRTRLENCGLWTPALKALIVQASISKQLGQERFAQEQIQHAITLAEPEGFVRIFVDQGEPVRSLISDAQHAIIHINKSGNEKQRLQYYLEQLLAAFSPKAAVSTPKPLAIQHPETDLIDPLTERENEVLQLISAGYSNKEIAEKLVVTVGTVKTHTSNIYRKLGVIGRTKALAKARALNLI